MPPYRAPSWSWASIEGTISTVTNPVVNSTLDPKVCTPKLEIVSTCVRPVEGGHPAGQAIDVNIVLKGRIKVAKLRKETKIGLYRLEDPNSETSNFPALLHPDFNLEERQKVRCLLLLSVDTFPVGSGVARAV